MTPKVLATRVWPDSVWAIPHNEVWNVPADADSVRFDIGARGPWNMVSSVKGLAILHTGHDTAHFEPYPNECQIIGIRSLNNPKESGYQMEGYVKANGRRYRAFTSSILAFRPDGKLCDIAVLYCCEPRTDGEPANV